MSLLDDDVERDDDLRRRFAELRSADLASAPAWPDELRGRKSTADARPRRRLPVQLAWAASLVLAIGSVYAVSHVLRPPVTAVALQDAGILSWTPVTDGFLP